MHDLDEELWKLGVPVKTKHNEVAPAQHELAPVFDTANVAVDHNQLTMEMMKKIADSHHLACLLHENHLKVSTEAESITTGPSSRIPARTFSIPGKLRRKIHSSLSF